MKLLRRLVSFSHFCTLSREIRRQYTTFAESAFSIFIVKQIFLGCSFWLVLLWRSPSAAKKDYSMNQKIINSQSAERYQIIKGPKNKQLTTEKRVSNSLEFSASSMFGAMSSFLWQDRFIPPQDFFSLFRKTEQLSDSAVRIFKSRFC